MGLEVEPEPVFEKLQFKPGLSKRQLKREKEKINKGGTSIYLVNNLEESKPLSLKKKPSVCTDPVLASELVN